MHVLAIDVTSHDFLVDLITIPLFTGAIGYITNWSGVVMLFQPLRFHGFRLPGLKLLYPLLPRRVQVIPAISDDGRLGWQGIVPSRVDKMASISVDKALAKVGSISDFYHQLEPDKVADHLVATAATNIEGDGPAAGLYGKSSYGRPHITGRRHRCRTLPQPRLQSA